MALGIDQLLHLNCLLLGLSRTEKPLVDTLAAAERCGLPLRRIVLEVTESEAITDPARWAVHLDGCRAMGLEVAIDDFGAGYAGLNSRACPLAGPRGNDGALSDSWMARRFVGRRLRLPGQ